MKVLVKMRSLILIIMISVMKTLIMMGLTHTNTAFLFLEPVIFVSIILRKEKWISLSCNLFIVNSLILTG